MIERVDHLGILVSDLETQRDKYEQIGLSVELVERVDEFEVDIAFLPVDGILVELIEPINRENELANVLAQSGQEALLHHIAFRVADIESTLRNLKASGIPLADEEPRPGAGGAQIAFLDTSGFGGVTLELVERKEEVAFQQ
jgi:methylmalonyl-CoA epimerase